MKGVVFLPLLVANVIREYSQAVVSGDIESNKETCNAADDIKVKWPNDLLKTTTDNNEENSVKVGGVLIQLIDGYFLIGIGINLFDSPKLLHDNGDIVGGSVEGKFRGREAGYV